MDAPVVPSANPFDVLADKHDTARWAPIPGGFDSYVDRILARVAQGTPGSVVALGGGSGPELRDFVRRGWKCTLVDTSARMLALAQGRFGGRVQYVHQDATRFLGRLADHTVSVVLHVGEAVCYVDDPEGLIQLSARVLAPGGHLVQTYVEATRLRKRLAEPPITYFPAGYSFVERRDPLLVMSAFEQAAVLAWHTRHGLDVLHSSLGPGPRGVVVSIQSSNVRTEQS